MAGITAVFAARDNMSGTMQGIGRNTDGLAGKMKGLATTIAAAFSVKAVFDFGKKIITTFEGYEKQMAVVKSITGANAEEFKALNAQARELGRTTIFTAEQAGQGMEYMAMAGWKTEQIIAGMPAVLNLAAASGEDLGRVSDIVTDALTAFGLQAEDTGRFTDVLAAASVNSNTNVSLMGETFKYVAPVAGALGFSIEDAALAIGLMANAGIKGSQAGTALRASFTRLVKPPKMAQDAMAELGLSVTDSGGKMLSLETILGDLRTKFGGLTEAEKANKVAAIFGTEAMSGMLAIINSSDADFNKLTDSIRNSTGAAEEMAKTQSDTLWGSFKALGSAVEGLMLDIGDAGLAKAVRFVADRLTELPEKLKSAAAAMREFLKPIEGVGKGLKESFSNLFNGEDLYDSFMPFMEGVTDSMYDLLPPDAADMVTDGLNGIMLIADGASKSFSNLFSGDYGIFDSFMPMMEDVRTAALGMFPEEMAENVANMFDGLIDIVDRFWTWISDIVMGKLKPLFLNWVNWLNETIFPIFAEFFNAIAPYIMPILENIFIIVSTVIDKLVDIFSFAFPFIKGIVEAAITAMKDIFGGLFQSLSGIIEFITGVFTGDWEKAWNGVKNIFGGIFKTLAGVLKAPLNAVIGLINGALEHINKINVDIPEWVPFWGGKSFGVNIPKIPMLEKGTRNWGGGLAGIGETGEPEIVTGPTLTNLSKGSNVIGVKDTKKILEGKGGGNVFNFEFHVDGASGDMEQMAQYFYNFFTNKIKEEMILGGNA